MKKLLLIALLCFNVQAKPIATMANNGGGKIVLLDDACVKNGKTYENWFRTYTYHETGVTQDGCWLVEHDTVVVIWDSGSKMRYPAINFTIIDTGKKQNL